MTQTVGINNLDYPNLVACRAVWDGGQRLLAGVLFGGSEPRIVQVDEYRLEARPEGIVLIMKNRDVPGVIGQVGTLLAAYEVNIGEWRLGRNKPGGEALSFINLDSRADGGCAARTGRDRGRHPGEGRPALMRSKERHGCLSRASWIRLDNP